VRLRSSELLGIGLVSGSTLMHEILLTRICALRLQFHFAYLVISNCMLALAAGGSVLARQQERLRADAEGWLGRIALAYAASLVVTYLGLRAWPLPQVLLLARPGHLLALTGFNLLGALPFFFSGILIGMLLTFRPEHASRLYGVDLFGAGIACLAVPLLLPPVGAGGVFVTTVLLAAVACIGLNWQRLGRSRLVLVGLTFIVGLGCLPRLDAWLPVPSKGEFWWLPTSMQPPIDASFWSSNSRVDVSLMPVEWPPLIYMRGRHKAQEYMPPTEWAYISQDASAGTALIDFSERPTGLEVLRRSMYSSAYRLRPGAAVMIIGLGGGNDVWAAKANGAASVRAVELNAPIVGIHRGLLRRYSRALVEDPTVELVVGEGRSELMRDERRYDVVQMSGIDTWTALTSGAYVLAENYLYTREAMVLLYDHLKPGGLIQIARFGDTMEALRLFSNIDAAFRVRGAGDIADSVIALTTDDRMMVVLVKKGRFTDAEQESTLAFCEQNGVDVRYMPKRPGTSLIDRFVRAADKARLIDEAPYNIAPTVDDSPYFFNYTRWDRPIGSLRHLADVPAVSQGNPFFILAQLGISALLCAALILWPLAGTPLRKQAGTAATLAYFSGLGAGFILLEIAIIQKLTLFLGQPMYSLTVTLFALLVFTGLGSLLLAPRLPATVRHAWLVPVLIVLYVALFNAFSPALFQSWIAASLAARFAVAGAVLAPLGLLLGVPFAYGLRVASKVDPLLATWGWAVNASTTVVGSIASVVLSMNFGFAAVLWVAAIVYGAAFAALSRVLGPENPSALPS
jgi:hypothetical protein